MPCPGKAPAGGRAPRSGRRWRRRRGVVTAGFGRIVRADGRRPWVWQGRPLYRDAGDAPPGDARGDGPNGTWHRAVEAAASAQATHP
ncbi:hypothetical protein ACFWZU_08860 [Frateuria sp. GZRR33]|uniref:hypothetical protein n=1 Tax=Frateuria sp. GZRR33 TaxID=3351535 RepID=UPI003EDBCCBE